MRTTFSWLSRELRNLPEPLLREVLDFVRSLKTNADRHSLCPSLMDEAFLARDWNLAEEDQAWRDL